jgi:hypothetical protein
MCAERQAEILDRAYEMLVPGGRMCYSTCTFAKAEDEEAVAAFVERHPDMKVVEERRLWPHKDKGEGHYACLLEKDGTFDGDRNYYDIKRPSDKMLVDYYAFIKEALKEPKEWKNNLLDGAKRDMIAFIAKYRRLTELAQVIEPMETLLDLLK